MKKSFVKIFLVVAALSIAACEKNNGSSVPVDSSVKAAGAGSGLEEQQGAGGQGAQRQQPGEQRQQQQQQAAAQNLPLNGIWVTRPLLPQEFPVPSNVLPDGTGRERQLASFEFNGSNATYIVHDCGDLSCRPNNFIGEPHIKVGVISSFEEVDADDSYRVTINWRKCQGMGPYDRDRGCGLQSFYFRVSRDGQRLITGYLNRAIPGGINWAPGEAYPYMRAQ